MGGVIAVNGALKKVDKFARVDVPSASSGAVNKARIHLDTGSYIAYYEASNATFRTDPACRCASPSPSGQAAPARHALRR